MGQVFKVAGAVQELQSPFSATYHKLKAKHALLKSDSSNVLAEQLRGLDQLVDRLETRYRELVRAASVQQLALDRLSADGYECDCSTMKRKLMQLLDQAEHQGFTKDQILQRLNEIVYPEIESAPGSSLSMQEQMLTAKTPLVFLPTNTLSPMLKRQLDSNRELELSNRPRALPPESALLPAIDQSIQTIKKVSPSDTYRRTETRKSVKTNRSVSHRNIASYLFQAPKLLVWLKNKFSAQPKQPESAKQISFRKSRFLANIPDQFKHSAPIQVFEVPPPDMPPPRSKSNKRSTFSSSDHH